MNHNGSIEYGEFLEWARGAALHDLARQKVEIEVKQVFNMLDSDKDGYISSEDLQTLIPNDSEAQQMIREQDVDMDGKINYSEFVFVMNS